MMKHVLIITSQSEKTAAWKERERYVQEFCRNVEDGLTDTTVTYTTYDDIEMTVNGREFRIYDHRNKRDLKDVHLVQFKNWMFETEEAPVIAYYLKAHGVAFFNSEVNMPIANGKLAQMVYLSQEGLPVPHTFYARRRRLTKLFESGELPEGFNLPLIMKANDGSRGDDNHLIKSNEQALQVLAETDPDTQFVLQNFIPNDGDYRFLFVGLNRQPLVFHRLAAGNSHLNNTSKGGTGRFLTSREVPSEQVAIAARACEVLGREIGGADILVDKETGKVYLLEVNGTPALATGYGVGTKTEYFTEFIAEQLALEEEE